MEKNMSLLLNCNEFVNQKKYWVSKLDGKLEETNFLPYISKGNAASRSFKIKETYINEELVKRMKKISKESDLALFTILIAAMKGLIYKYTNKEDITISSPIYINNIDGSKHIIRSI